MKKILAFFVVSLLLLASCGKDKKEEVKQNVNAATEEVENAVDNAEKAVADKMDQVEWGKKLFTEKTCSTCHAPETKLVGPSIKDIVAIYKKENANIVKFLRGKSPAIVDTDPGQVAIMKANIEGFVHDMTGDELQAVARYMRTFE